MKGKLLELGVKGRVRLMKAVEQFTSEEKGASHMVEIIVVIVIILAVAAVFRDNITAAVEKVMKRFTEFVG